MTVSRSAVVRRRAVDPDVPFAAVTDFLDPAVDFSLKFQANGREDCPRSMTRPTTTRRSTSRPTTDRTSSRSISRGKSNELTAHCLSSARKLRSPNGRDTRTETDSFGPIEVPGDCYWGAQTQRSIANFPFGARERMPVEIVHALGFVKQAAARVNARHGGLDAAVAEAIQQAAGEVARGDLDDQFPLVIWQTGSGTQSNMNANEVIAGRANEKLTGKRGGKEPVHPNDHVNMGQSSNDSFPTAMHVAAARGVQRGCSRRSRRCTPADRPRQALGPDRQDRPHPSAGRDPADARPGILRLCGADRGQFERVEPVLPRLYRLAQGGTAVGTGLNAPKGFAEAFAKEIAKLTQLPFTTRAQQVRRARRARYAGRAVGRAQHASRCR